MRSELHSRGVAKSRALRMESERLHETLADLRRDFPDAEKLHAMSDTEIDRHVQRFMTSDHVIELAFPPLPEEAAAHADNGVVSTAGIVVEALRTTSSFVGLRASSNATLNAIVAELVAKDLDAWKDRVDELARATTLIDRARAVVGMTRAAVESGAGSRLLELAAGTLPPWDWIVSAVMVRGPLAEVLESNGDHLRELALNVGPIATVQRAAKAAVG